MSEHMGETERLESHLLGVLQAHAECDRQSTVEVHSDKSGTLHYPCGGRVVRPHGLERAYQQHLAVALAAEAEYVLSRPGNSGGDA